MSCETQDSYYHAFHQLFHCISVSTQQPVHFHHIHGRGIRAILADMDTKQASGILTKITEALWSLTDTIQALVHSCLILNLFDSQKQSIFSTSLFGVSFITGVVSHSSFETFVGVRPCTIYHSRMIAQTSCVFFKHSGVSLSPQPGHNISKTSGFFQAFVHHLQR